jgi:predicted transcriptional regulator
MSAGAALPTTLKLDPALKHRIERLAERRERTPHWIMQRAVSDYVEREEARDDFHAEAVAAWTAWQETGEHLTGAEVAGWLAGWGTDTEQPAPAPHG